MIPNDKKIGPWTYIWAFIRFATAAISRSHIDIELAQPMWMKTLDIVLILTWETELGVCDRFDLVSTAEKGENGTTVSIFKIKSYSSEMKLSWTTYWFFSLLILFILPRHSNSVNVNVWSWYIYLFHFLLQHQESNVYVQPNVSLLSQSLRFVSNQYSAKADTHTFMSLTQDSLTHSLLCINKLKYDSVSQCMLLNFLLLPPSSVVPSVLPQNQHLAL